MIFFGTFLVLALTGTWLIDRRKAATLGDGWRRFAAVTSNVPFMAIASGRNEFNLREIGGWKILLGLAAYVALLLLHHRLFGQHVLP